MLKNKKILLVSGLIIAVALFATGVIVYQKNKTAKVPDQPLVGVTICFPQQGCTGIGSYTAGDIIYANGQYSLVKLASSTPGSILNMNGSRLPAWTRTLGAPDNSLLAGYFSQMNASSSIIDTLYISNTIKPGPLKVSTSTPPDVRFEYDVDSGLGWISDNKIGLYTGNVANLTVDSSGNLNLPAYTNLNNLLYVGTGGLVKQIATSSLGLLTTNVAEGTNLYYTDARVGSYITGSSTLPAFVNYWGKSGSNVYYTAGSVGIGTTSPVTTLDINGAAATLWVGPHYGNPDRDYIKLTAHGTDTRIDSPNERFLINNSSGALVLQDAGGNVGIGTTGPGDNLEISDTTGGAPGMRMRWASGDNYLDLTGDNTNGVIFNNVDNIATSFKVNGADVMYLKSGGNVGIGTTGPTGKLNISDGVNAAGTYTALNLSKGSAYGETHFDTFYTAVGNYGTTIGGMLTTNVGNGNVGIGTTSPSQKLAVAGLMYIGGAGTSTIESNLYVMGTLRSTASYVGDLIFKNGFRFTEDGNDLLLLNKDGKQTLKIGDDGQIVGNFGVDKKEIEQMVNDAIDKRIAELSLWKLILLKIQSWLK